ncbi:MAG: hypothetical protein NVSMB57_05870 [Actinomycetota bacterium]
MTTLYTIGYQRRTHEQILEALRKNGIALLIDVRDVPWSRKRGFSKSKLAEAMEAGGVTYEHRRALGSPATVREIWKKDLDAGRAAFTALAHESKIESIDALTETAQSQPTAILCLEEDPHTCHRSIVAALAAERGGLTIVDL